MVGEVLFMDTNTLLTATDGARPLHRQAIQLFEEADSRGFQLGANSQVMRQGLAVSTRPVQSSGLGLGVAAVAESLGQRLKLASLIGEAESVAFRLLQIVATCAVASKRVHDAGIVATMMGHNINFLVTHSGADFAQFKEIEMVSLEEALAQTKPNETVRLH